jgi:hypothetical protein
MPLPVEQPAPMGLFWSLIGGGMLVAVALMVRAFRTLSK